MLRHLATTVAVVVAVTACAGDPDEAPSPETLTPTTLTRPTTATASTETIDIVPADSESPSLARVLDPVCASVPGGCLAVAVEGALVFERGRDVMAAPASTVKVATGAAVLAGLGADTKLRTVVATARPPEAGVVTGDLWLVGGGDPVLGTDAWASSQLDDDEPRTSLDALADAVVADGVQRIEGSVVGDGSRYDDERYVPSWPDHLVADGEAGPLGALRVNGGQREWGHPGVAFDDLPLGAAEVFAGLLEDRGVDVGGGWRTGSSPKSVVVVAEASSPPVGELVVSMLRHSNNNTAELLLKELGLDQQGAGSTQAGLDAMRELLASRGVRWEQRSVADGSGLSATTRLRCRDLVAVLDAFAPELSGRMAVAGASGTLRRRLIGTPAEGMQAKTGSLEGVSGLAGYVPGPEGATYTFALLAHDLPHTATGRLLQDTVAVALASTPPS